MGIGVYEYFYAHIVVQPSCFLMNPLGGLVLSPSDFLPSRFRELYPILDHVVVIVDGQQHRFADIISDKRFRVLGGRPLIMFLALLGNMKDGARWFVSPPALSLPVVEEHIRDKVSLYFNGPDPLTWVTLEYKSTDTLICSVGCIDIYRSSVDCPDRNRVYSSVVMGAVLNGLRAASDRYVDKFSFSDMRMYDTDPLMYAIYAWRERQSLLDQCFFDDVVAPGDGSGVAKARWPNCDSSDVSPAFPTTAHSTIKDALRNGDKTKPLLLSYISMFMDEEDWIEASKFRDVTVMDDVSPSKGFVRYADNIWKSEVVVPTINFVDRDVPYTTNLVINRNRIVFREMSVYLDYLMFSSPKSIINVSERSLADMLEAKGFLVNFVRKDRSYMVFSATWQDLIYYEKLKYNQIYFGPVGRVVCIKMIDNIPTQVEPRKIYKIKLKNVNMTLRDRFASHIYEDYFYFSWYRDEYDRSSLPYVGRCEKWPPLVYTTDKQVVITLERAHVLKWGIGFRTWMQRLKENDVVCYYDVGRLVVQLGVTYERGLRDLRFLGFLI